MSVERLHPNSPTLESVGLRAPFTESAPVRESWGIGPGWHLRRLTIALLLFLPLALAQPHDDAEPHFLKGQAICADADSIMITLGNVDTSRAQAVKPELIQDLTSVLHNALGSTNVRSSFPTSCTGRRGYLVIFANVTFLDTTVYSDYGANSFRYAVSVQVGDKGDLNYLIDHNVLANLQFIAFDEQVASEQGQGARPFEERVVTSSEALIEQLVQAWREDNP